MWPPGGGEESEIGGFEASEFGFVFGKTTRVSATVYRINLLNPGASLTPPPKLVIDNHGYQFPVRIDVLVIRPRPSCEDETQVRQASLLAFEALEECGALIAGHFVAQRYVIPFDDGSEEESRCSS